MLTSVHIRCLIPFVTLVVSCAGENSTTLDSTSDDALADLSVSDRSTTDALTDALTDAGLPDFTDVPSTHAMYKAVMWVANKGIMAGCSKSPPVFCVDYDLTRAQAAVSLVTMKFGSSFSYTTTQIFDDVATTHWAFKFIQKLYDAGITAGCSTSPLNFCPDSSVTRAQAATLLILAKYGSTFSCSQTPHFSDVLATHASFNFIQKAFEDNITAGCGGGKFCPDTKITRGGWAVFLFGAKTLGP